MADPVRVCKALGDETRLRLVRLLARGGLNVHEVTTVLGMGQSRISRHLRILADAGLVEHRRQGTWVYYQTLAAAAGLAGDLLDSLARHEDQIPGFGADMEALERVVEQRHARSRAFFDSLTDPHELCQGLDGAAYRAAALALLPARCGTVVDLGSGAGLLLPGLLERAERVIAVDASQTMLEMARRTVGAEAPRCDFRLGDLAHLPVADGEADAVVACMVLHHVSHPDRALAEARRVLRAGGVLAVVDLLQHQEESLRERMADLWLGFTPDELRGWADAQGFHDVAVEVRAVPGALSLITLQGANT